MEKSSLSKILSEIGMREEDIEVVIEELSNKNDIRLANKVEVADSGLNSTGASKVRDQKTSKNISEAKIVSPSVNRNPSLISREENIKSSAYAKDNCNGLVMPLEVTTVTTATVMETFLSTCKIAQVFCYADVFSSNFSTLNCHLQCIVQVTIREVSSA